MPKQVSKPKNLRITPMNHICAAIEWFQAYHLLTWDKNKTPASGIVAYFCLFQAFELYLKAYISFRDTSLLYSDNIKKYNHNIRKLIDKVELYCPKELRRRLEVIYKKEVIKYSHTGEEMDFSQLRYLCTGSSLILNPKILKGECDRFMYVGGYIEGVVRKGFSKYYENVIKPLENT